MGNVADIQHVLFLDQHLGVASPFQSFVRWEEDFSPKVWLESESGNGCLQLVWIYFSLTLRFEPFSGMCVSFHLFHSSRSSNFSLQVCVLALRRSTDELGTRNAWKICDAVYFFSQSLSPAGFARTATLDPTTTLSHAYRSEAPLPDALVSLPRFTTLSLAIRVFFLRLISTSVTSIVCCEIMRSSCLCATPLPLLAVAILLSNSVWDSSLYIRHTISVAVSVEKRFLTWVHVLAPF